jgi:alginate O-acetyltransferase complex protein AlgJ
MSLAKMPCILVVVTMGYLAVIQFGNFLSIGTYGRWRSESLDEVYLKESAKYVRAPVNRVRTWMGLDANDVVVRGSELYYLPDIEHVMGRSFLAQRRRNRHLALKKEPSDERTKSPLPAILDFDRELREQGIRLVLMPTPSKAMFAGRGEAPMQNAGFASFLTVMAKHGIPVLDLAPHFAEREKKGEPLFLKTDSHWTPETMRLSAELLAELIRERGLVPAGRTEGFEVTFRKVTNEGDLAVLHYGVEKKRWRETVTVSSVGLGEGPLRWTPAPDAPVLLLGDSFTNVFSLDAMNWGVSGGLGETLSVVLGFSIDRIVRNADGAFASRQELIRQRERLEGKAVVVWQFAARELSFGDWKRLPMPKRGSDASDDPGGEGAIEIAGTIAQVAKVPPLTRAPYRQAVMEVKLKKVSGSNGELPAELVLLGIAIDDRKPTALSKWKAGEKVKVRAVPWSEVEKQYGRLHRFALEDPEYELLDTRRVWMVQEP